jgi:hypothetical protein
MNENSKERKLKIFKILTYLCLTIPLLLSINSEGANCQVGMGVGYYHGISWQLHGDVSNFATDFPLTARLAIGYTYLDPGNSTAARRIFINNATNGIPEKSGGIWNYRFDLLLPIRLKSIPNANLLFGPRYTRYKGNFKFIGVNEDFDITSAQWGLGIGLESSFSMSRILALRLLAGLDHLFKSDLKGHDTSYSPNGENINPREDYSFSDADKAINQPGSELYIMIGFIYRL